MFPFGDLLFLVFYLAAISLQFQEPSFASLSGARVVRIATHSEMQKVSSSQCS